MKSILLLLLSLNSFAEEVYPTKLPPRLLGFDQKQVGACQAESEVSALEHAFAERGYSVMFSTYHRHAYNYVHDQGRSQQEYLAGDVQQIAALSQFTPHYIWPEDGELNSAGYDHRPSIQKNGAYIPGFPPLLINTVQLYYMMPFGGGSSFEALKQAVRLKMPITHSIHGDILYKFDHTTGLLTEPYNRNWFPGADFLNLQNHSVAVVGFDDSLYGGRGAFIVHNSWNDKWSARESDEALYDLSKQADLANMRLKISEGKNLPGYFALPYAYFRDLIAFGHPHSGISRRLYVNYEQVYQVYSENAGRVQEYRVPFICDRREWNALVEEYEYLKSFKDSTAHGSADYTNYLMRRIYTTERAKLPVANAAGINRFRDLAEGKLWDFYCKDKRGEDRFPNMNDFEDLRFRQVFEENYGDHGGLTFWIELLDWAVCNKNGGC